MSLFKPKPKSILGIDIGTSSIKVVQLKKEEDKFKLESYGELSTVGYLERLNDSFQITSFKKLEVVTREMLKILIERSKITANDTVMAIPIFSSFVSVIEMPEMGEKELERSIEFEARRYIPIPLTEVVFDWKVLDQGMIKDDVIKKPFKGKRILIIAVPKEVVNKYMRIAEALGLKIKALELESFSLGRSLIMDSKSSACILDIGARATSFVIVDKSTVQMSHSLDTAGAEMTKNLATGLGITQVRAEELKTTFGLNHESDADSRHEFKELLNISIDKIITEIDRMINNYQSKTNRKIEKLILNGGSAKLIGISNYIEKKLNIKAVVADPWLKIIYPPMLQETLKEIGPQFSVTVGAAMREN
jgi:type IV pilus assembly protein PilM